MLQNAFQCYVMVAPSLKSVTLLLAILSDVLPIIYAINHSAGLAKRCDDRVISGTKKQDDKLSNNIISLDVTKILTIGYVQVARLF
jgi:hypothetical protein